MSALPVGRGFPIRPDPTVSSSPQRSVAETIPHRSGDTIATGTHAPAPDLRDAARHRASSGGGPNASAKRTELVRALLVHVPPPDRQAAAKAIPAILDAARKAGSTDPNQIAYFLATAQTESDFGANMVEIGHSPDWYNRNYGCEDGNRPGTNDGYRYRGRGYVQTTHAGRYAAVSHHLGLPDVPAMDHGKTIIDAHGKPTLQPALVAHPEKLAEPALAAAALVIGVKHNLFTGNPAAAIDKTIPAGKPPGDVDFYHARGIVNGIVKAQAETIATHATTYARILDGFRHSVLGLPATK